MSADRLAELLRQRALLQDHVAWLDREIAAVTGQPAAPDPAVLPPQTDAVTSGETFASPMSSPVSSVTSEAEAAPAFSAVSPVVSAPVAPQAVLVADAILDEYRVAPDALKTDVRKGCFLYLLLAFAVLGLGVTALYFTIGRR